MADVELICILKDDRERLIREKDRMIRDNDRLVEAIEQSYVSQIALISDRLTRSNTEILKLSGSLSVRGMIEKIEVQYSEKRRTDRDATRTAVWNEILDTSPVLRKSLTGSVPGATEMTRRASAIVIIAEIYRKASAEIHHQGYDEIPIETKIFKGAELPVLRALCVSENYAFKEY
jgi:hypothetical protein